MLTTEAKDKELSGAELDRAIAERVMGWIWMKRVGQNNAWLFPPDSIDVNTGEEGMFGEPIITRGHIVGPFEEYDGTARKNESDVPPYSSSIEAAMQIVDKTIADGCDPEMIGHNGWYVVFKRTDAPERRSFAATLPEAICRAALAAIGSKSE